MESLSLHAVIIRLTLAGLSYGKGGCSAPSKTYLPVTAARDTAGFENWYDISLLGRQIFVERGRGDSEAWEINRFLEESTHGRDAEENQYAGDQEDAAH